MTLCRSNAAMTAKTLPESDGNACPAEISRFRMRLQQLLRDHEDALCQLMSETHSHSWCRTECAAGDQLVLTSELNRYPADRNPCRSIDLDLLIERQADSQIHMESFDNHTLNPTVTTAVPGEGDELFNARIDVEDRITTFVREHDRSLIHYFRIDELIEKMNVIEPVHRGRLAQLVQSKTFENVVFAIITLNCIFIIFETNHEMQHLREPKAGLIRASDKFFAGCYVIELLLRLKVHGFYFFCGPSMAWNLFDFTLVAINTVEQLFSWMGQQTHNLVVARFVRLLKVGKVLRAVRLVYFLTELRLMVMCLLGSFWALIWSFVVLFFIQLMFAIVLVQDTANRLRSEGLPPDKKDVSKIFEAFGSVEKAVFTLFLDVSGGQDWNDTYSIFRKGSIFARAAYIIYTDHVAFCYKYHLQLVY